jgi:hypothetical protein
MLGGMELSLMAAAGRVSGDLVVGLLLGLCIGLLGGPAFRSWQTFREWADASRDVVLEDRLLERLESDAELDDDLLPRADDDVPLGSTWRTRP